MIYMGDIYDFCADHYLWIKSLHIISMVAWMAGLLYLPRLFVYHAAATPGTELSETILGGITPAQVETLLTDLGAIRDNLRRALSRPADEKSKHYG